MSKATPFKEITLSGYIAGLVCSLALTLAAYSLVSRHVNSEGGVYSVGLLTGLVIALAITQLLVQLVFFLHLGRQSKPRWNLLVLSFAAIVVFIVVAGSLWIMKNLNYHHENTSPRSSDQYIIKDEGYSP